MARSNIDPKVLVSWVTTIQEEGRGLTDWEQKFMEGMLEKVEEENHFFTEAEGRVIDRIYTQRVK